MEKEWVLLLVAAIGAVLLATFGPNQGVTGHVTYEQRQRLWDFSTPGDYQYNSSINISGGVRLAVVTVTSIQYDSTTNQSKAINALLVDDENETEDALAMIAAVDNSHASLSKNKALDITFSHALGNGDNISIYMGPSKADKLRICLSSGCASPGYGEVSHSKDKGWYTITLAGLPYQTAGITLDSDSTVKVDYVEANYTDQYAFYVYSNSYAAAGEIQSADFTPSSMDKWGNFSASAVLNGQAVEYYYSTDSGSTWSVAGQDLSAAAAGKIMFKAILKGSGVETPVLMAIAANYSRANCTESWQAAYGQCLPNDSRQKIYADANTCGTSDGIPADNGTYGACDYCTPNLLLRNTSCLRNDTLVMWAEDLNSCYGQTLLESDRVPANTTFGCDFCTPLWTEFNGSCLVNDTIISYYLDSSLCYNKTGLQSDNSHPSNKSYLCDFCAPSWTCRSYGSCAGGFRQCTNITDINSCYGKSLLLSDTYSGNGSEFQQSCSSQPRLAGYNMPEAATGILTVTARIINETEVNTSVTLYREGQVALNEAGQNVNGTFNYTFNLSRLAGLFIAKLHIGSENNTLGAVAISKVAEVKTENATGQATLTSSNTTARIKYSDNITRQVYMAEYNESPVNISTEAMPLEKFVEITHSAEANVSSAEITIAYDEHAAIDESTIKVYYYNETSANWQAENSTVNTTANRVTANVTHLSLFGAFGQQRQAGPTAIAAPSSSAGSSSGGSAGSTSTGGTPPRQASRQQAPQEVRQPSPQKKPGKPQPENCTDIQLIGLPDQIYIADQSSFQATIASVSQCDGHEFRFVAAAKLSGKIELRYGSSLPSTLLITPRQANATKADSPGGFAVKSSQPRLMQATGNLTAYAYSAGRLVYERQIPVTVEYYELEEQQKAELPALVIGLAAAGLIVLALLVRKR